MAQLPVSIVLKWPKNDCRNAISNLWLFIFYLLLTYSYVKHLQHAKRQCDETCMPHHISPITSKAYKHIQTITFLTYPSKLAENSFLNKCQVNTFTLSSVVDEIDILFLLVRGEMYQNPYKYLTGARRKAKRYLACERLRFKCTFCILEHYYACRIYVNINPGHRILI